MNPFDIVNAINSNTPIDIDEKKYPAYIVNRSLSNFPDTVLLANEMNLKSHIDPQLQFDFFINTIRKRKRFSKWHKQIKSEDLDAVKLYFGYSNERAREALSLLSNEQLVELKNKVYQGGRK